MKRETKAFIASELGDVATTLAGLTIVGISEANPLANVLAKMLAILFVSLVIEKINFSKAIWIVPAVASLAVIWNLVVIIFEIFRLG